MKIKKIILYNIGPYVDKNVFDLSSDEKRNIVLIGGKNGAGKTTFFKAIKTCLYGCRVWGFDAPGKEYYSIISNLLNSKLQYDISARGYVEVELEFNDGKQIETYKLHREWEKKKKSIDETFLIYKDSELLDEESQANFINYLLSIIPPDMFNFYFFDGESIADFFLGNNDGKNFRNAFLKLYGLDTLSLMVENFERYFKRKDGGNAIFLEYRETKERVQKCDELLNQMREHQNNLENQIDLMQIKQQALYKEYAKVGGISLTEWKEINAALTKEESKRDEINRWLKEIANHYLPFVIVKNQMNTLLSELEMAQERNKQLAVSAILEDDSFKKSVYEFLKQKGIAESDVGELIQFMRNLSVGNGVQKDLFDLSNSQMNKLIAQIYEKLEFDPQMILKSMRALSVSLKNTKKLRDKLSMSSIDGYEEYSEQKDNIEKKILGLKLELEKLLQEISIKEAEKEQYVSTFNKVKENYEKQLKSKSITDLSSRAIGVYTLLEDELIKRQGKILQDAFMECFSAIINKDNFIDGIVVDKNINVIPYKFVDVTFLQIEKYLQTNEKTHFLDMFDVKYRLEINKLRLGEKEIISLPSPITAPFSQGERQVYIMALYLALLRTSRQDIPFFIDTPFARIDSNHREKIVEEFFNKITNQIFLLSTDEEIVGEYESQIDEKVSDRFLLSINNYGNTTVIPLKYFEV